MRYVPFLLLVLAACRDEVPDVSKPTELVDGGEEAGSEAGSVTPSDDGGSSGAAPDTGTCLRVPDQDAECTDGFDRAWLCPAPVPPEDVCTRLASEDGNYKYCCR